MSGSSLADSPGAWYGEEPWKPVMAVLRGLSVDETVRLARIAWDLGIRQVEVPIERPGALEPLGATVDAARERGLIVGAGTIVTMQQLDAALAAGARYLVSPGLDPALVLEARSRGVPFLPGVATASEILAAQRLGLEWVKAFPATVLGADWVRAIRGPFPGLHIVATGGIDGSNAGDVLRAGADVVGVGKALADPRQAAIIRELVA